MPEHYLSMEEVDVSNEIRTRITKALINVNTNRNSFHEANNLLRETVITTNLRETVITNNLSSVVNSHNQFQENVSHTNRIMFKCKQ